MWTAGGEGLSGWPHYQFMYCQLPQRCYKQVALHFVASLSSRTLLHSFTCSNLQPVLLVPGPISFPLFRKKSIQIDLKPFSSAGKVWVGNLRINISLLELWISLWLLQLSFRLSVSEVEGATLEINHCVRLDHRKRSVKNLRLNPNVMHVSVVLLRLQTRPLHRPVGASPRFRCRFPLECCRLCS